MSQTPGTTAITAVTIKIQKKTVSIGSGNSITVPVIAIPYNYTITATIDPAI